MKPKILHIIYSLEIGGAERDLVLKSKELSSDFDFTILTLCRKGEFARDIPNIPVINLKMKSKYDLKAIIKFFRAYFRIKPDIIHCHLFNAGFFGRFLSLFFNVERIYTVQMIRPYRPIWQKLVDYLLQFSTSKIIAASIAIAKSLEKENIQKKRIEVIYNSVDLRKFQNNIKREIRAEFGIPEHAFLIGSVSRLNIDKGIDFLVESAALLKKYEDIYFIVFGEGDERKRLERMIVENKLSDRFFLPGYAEYPAKILGNFDIFVLPSRTEGLGISIIEAQAAGLPVIASEIGGIPEIIEHGENGLLFEMGNSKMLSENIIRLYNDKKLRKKFSENSIINSKRFESKNLSEKMRRIYLSIL